MSTPSHESLPQFLDAATAGTDGNADNAGRQQRPPTLGPQHLPTYLQSLLSVRIPVVVTLAQTKRCIDEIVKLGPGAIIQFDKACDEMLDLEAGGHCIAEGEAVKVGEHFGLRITAMRLPDERFKAVGK